MSVEDFSVITLTETRPFVKSVKTEESLRYRKFKKKNSTIKNDQEENETLLVQSLPNIQPRRFSKLRNSFRKLNCFKGAKRDEELPMKEVPRHKSIDIGVGLARRMSLFLFTRRTVCVHPYHPFTPEQTTRKIYFFSEKNEHH